MDGGTRTQPTEYANRPSSPSLPVGEPPPTCAADSAPGDDNNDGCHVVAPEYSQQIPQQQAFGIMSFDPSLPIVTPTPTRASVSAAVTPVLPTIPSDEDSSSDERNSTSSHVDRGRSNSSISRSPEIRDPSDVEKAATTRSRRTSSVRPPGYDAIRRLSAASIQELTSAPESLPIAIAPPAPPASLSAPQSPPDDIVTMTLEQKESPHVPESTFYPMRQSLLDSLEISRDSSGHSVYSFRTPRPNPPSRTLSTPPINRRFDDQSRTSPRRNSVHPVHRPPPINIQAIKNPPSGQQPPSPMPTSIPLPPMSLPTLLQLELAAQRPSPLYIHHSAANDIPYESSAVKFERLKNVLLLPTYLERTLNFGALACLDAWLHTFTILPMRFVIAVSVLVKWWGYVVVKEIKWLLGFVWYGIGRVWARARHGRRDDRDIKGDASETERSEAAPDDGPLRSPRLKRVRRGRAFGPFRHRRTRSMPSNLSSYHKADILQGAIILCTSVALMRLDASRMYHFIRAQSDIKLYVVFNLLEIGDKLLSALGQDIFECLFSSETLSRNSSGRSKVLLPLGMFVLSLAYNITHSIVLYYQVITLNVAVNSYSNALLTLLLSNQFVEIKSTVFKRIEKDNLFQLTCADIVERFQLWVMLFIIGMRNVVEVGGLSVPGAGWTSSGESESSGTMPIHSPSILPHSFTVLPSWLKSAEVLSPFLIIVASEIIVDTVKHAYVTKFNNIKPKFYSRILDIICKDYYTNAFVTPSLTRRLGLATIPLSCLFIRAAVQTYHMFLAMHVPSPVVFSTQTSLSEESVVPSTTAMTAALDKFDSKIRGALGRSVYGYPFRPSGARRAWWNLTKDDGIAALTMLVVFFIAFLIMLIMKLVLGMVLLRYSRNRYAEMKVKESLVTKGKASVDSYDVKGKRLGGFGQVELSEERQRWINVDEAEGLRRKPLPDKDKDKAAPVEYSGAGVARYEMVAKRIW